MPYNFLNVQKVEGSLKQRLNDFLFSFGPAISNGTGITFADNDINYAIKQQHERIKEKGLDIQYETYDRGVLTDVYAGGYWADAHYENHVCFKDCGIRRRVTKNGSLLYSDDKKFIFYETLTDVPAGMQPVNDSYCCPNCAAITTIGELVNGCPYCGTHYKMDDLFPKITDYYCIDDFARGKAELKPKMLKYIGGSVIVFALSSLIGSIVNGNYANRHNIAAVIFEIIFSMIVTGLMGAFLGYLLFSLSLLFTLVGRGIKSGDKLGTVGSRNRFESRMRAVSPEFSFEYFTSKAVSLIKTAVFSKDEQELVFYKGGKLDPVFKNIIDLNYGGALGVVDFKEENGLTPVYTNAFCDVLYIKDGKILYKHMVFGTTFCRRTDVPIDFNFSITKIQCPTCAASFDATRTKTCPHCGNVYDIADSSEWVITEMKLGKGRW